MFSLASLLGVCMFTSIFLGTIFFVGYSGLVAISKVAAKEWTISLIISLVITICLLFSIFMIVNGVCIWTE